jgi:hypothetical protein
MFNKEFLLASLLALSMPVNALVVDMSSKDWLSAGDGLITYDASSGLEWLDLTATFGNSILETEAESFVVDGTWRWATIDEYFSLWKDIDLTSTSTSRHFSGGAQVNDIQAVMRFLGGSDSSALGTSRLFTIPSTGVKFGLGAAIIDQSFSPTQAFVSYDSPYETGITELSTSSTRGSFLVRTSVVPVPAAAWLFGTALLGLAGIKCRK